MIPRELFLSFSIFLAPLLHGQQFDLNNIKIDDVKNVLQGVLGKTEKTNLKWSGSPGDPNFNIADRIAIKDVIDAYVSYCLRLLFIYLGQNGSVLKLSFITFDSIFSFLF